MKRNDKTLLKDAFTALAEVWPQQEVIIASHGLSYKDTALNIARILNLEPDLSDLRRREDWQTHHLAYDDILRACENHARTAGQSIEQYAAAIRAPADLHNNKNAPAVVSSGSSHTVKQWSRGIACALFLAVAGGSGYSCNKACDAGDDNECHIGDPPPYGRTGENCGAITVWSILSQFGMIGGVLGAREMLDAALQERQKKKTAAANLSRSS